MSTSSEDENLDTFREAVDEQFQYKFQKTFEDPKSNENAMPSLRRNPDMEDESLNYFKVSPEFQNYVAKQLIKILDAKLADEISLQSSDKGTTVKQKDRVKLFSNSPKCLKVSICNVGHVAKPAAKCSDEIIEAELQTKAEMVAVDGKSIMAKDDVRFWSTRSKAKVFYYKNQNGVLIEK